MPVFWGRRQPFGPLALRGSLCGVARRVDGRGLPRSNRLCLRDEGAAESVVIGPRPS